MFYVIMKFKNYILCHKLYIIIIIIFQYLMKFIKMSYRELIGIQYLIARSLMNLGIILLTR